MAQALDGVADVRMISALADEEFLGRVRRVGGAAGRRKVNVNGGRVW